MDYRLKVNNGKVKYLLKTGNDFSASEMPVSYAWHIIDCGEQVVSDRQDYPICIDGSWYFEGAAIEEIPQPQQKKKKKWR